MKCLNCNKEIIKIGGSFSEHCHGIEPGQKHLFERKDGSRFVRCPDCKARNILIDITIPNTQIQQNQKFIRFDFK